LLKNDARIQVLTRPNGPQHGRQAQSQRDASLKHGQTVWKSQYLLTSGNTGGIRGAVEGYSAP
jgi:hypothetical protein